jgi:hypothetical protein
MRPQKRLALTDFGRGWTAKKRHPATRIPPYKTEKSGIFGRRRFTAQ